MAALGSAKATVTTASSIIVPENLGRYSLVIVNNGTANIFITEGPTAVLDEGIRLNAGGGTYDQRRRHPRERMYIGAISAIVAAGTEDVTIMERDTRV